MTKQEFKLSNRSYHVNNFNPAEFFKIYDYFEEYDANKIYEIKEFKHDYGKE